MNIRKSCMEEQKHLGIGIIRDLFKDREWVKYTLHKADKDSFGIIDRDNKYYIAFDEFEHYYKGDFIKPLEHIQITRKEHQYTIVSHVYGDNIRIDLYYRNEVR